MKREQLNFEMKYKIMQVQRQDRDFELREKHTRDETDRKHREMQAVEREAYANAAKTQVETKLLNLLKEKKSY